MTRHSSRMLADRRALRSRPSPQPQRARASRCWSATTSMRRGRTLTRESLAAREPGMWKWRELLPHDGSRSASASRKRRSSPLAQYRRSRTCWSRTRGGLPTGSFKARGLAMAVTMARQFGIERIAMPTNGNAGAALAAYGARAGIETIVICPAETPEINVTETAAYGARVYVADGQIDECGALVGKGAAEGLWFDCSTLKEPYRLEGKKVMGFELAEQLGWELPDAIFYPTGGGTGLIGMWKAFDELEAVGLIGLEAAAHVCGPGRRLRADRARVRARRRVRRALGACGDGRDRHPRAQGGRRFPDPARGARERRRGDRGSEEAILQAVEDAARDDGFLLCPEGGAVLAAWRQALERGLVGRDERVLLFNCANGNKYPLPDRSTKLELDERRSRRRWRDKFRRPRNE